MVCYVEDAVNMDTNSVFVRTVDGSGTNELRGQLKNSSTLDLVFSADLVTSNAIDITVNGTAMTQVTFDTDHDTTMDLIVASLAALTGVEAELDATDTNNRTIRVSNTTQNIVINSAAVTGGASQATITASAVKSVIYSQAKFKESRSAAGLIGVSIEDRP